MEKIPQIVHLDVDDGQVDERLEEAVLDGANIGLHGQASDALEDERMHQRFLEREVVALHGERCWSLSRSHSKNWPD